MRYIVLALLTVCMLVPASAEACGMYISEPLLVKEKTATDVKVSINKITSENLLNVFAEIDAIKSPVLEKSIPAKESDKVEITNTITPES